MPSWIGDTFVNEPNSIDEPHCYKNGNYALAEDLFPHASLHDRTALVYICVREAGITESSPTSEP